MKKYLKEEAIALFDSGENRSFDEIYGKDNQLFNEGIDDIIDPKMKKLFEATYSSATQGLKTLREKQTLREGDQQDAVQAVLENWDATVEGIKAGYKQLPLKIRKALEERAADMSLEEIIEGVCEELGIETAEDLNDLSEEDKQKLVGSLLFTAIAKNALDELKSLLTSGIHKLTEAYEITKEPGFFRSGVKTDWSEYVNNTTNQKLGRVGQKYGFSTTKIPSKFSQGLSKAAEPIKRIAGFIGLMITGALGMAIIPAVATFIDVFKLKVMADAGGEVASQLGGNVAEIGNGIIQIGSAAFRAGTIFEGIAATLVLGALGAIGGAFVGKKVFLDEQEDIFTNIYKSNHIKEGLDGSFDIGDFVETPEDGPGEIVDYEGPIDDEIIYEVALELDNGTLGSYAESQLTHANRSDYPELDY
jgi:hypothetical protein